VPQQANSYMWIPLARAAAVKGSFADGLIGGCRRRWRWQA
jgi:hypothetical protein